MATSNGPGISDYVEKANVLHMSGLRFHQGIRSVNMLAKMMEERFKCEEKMAHVLEDNSCDWSKKLADISSEGNRGITSGFEFDRALQLSDKYCPPLAYITFALKPRDSTEPIRIGRPNTPTNQMWQTANLSLAQILRDKSHLNKIQFISVFKIFSHLISYSVQTFEIKTLYPNCLYSFQLENNSSRIDKLWQTNARVKWYGKNCGC